MINSNHHGLAIKKLFKEKNLSITSLIEPTGRSRQQIHNDFNRVTIKDEVLEIYARVMNMPKEELYKVLNSKSVLQDSPPSNYLMDHLEKLEEQFQQLLKQLEIKDKQLELKDKQLEKLIDILGKHKDELQMTPESKLRVAA